MHLTKLIKPINKGQQYVNATIYFSIYMDWTLDYVYSKQGTAYFNFPVIKIKKIALRELENGR